MKRLISMCFTVFLASMFATPANCEEQTSMDAVRLMQSGKATEAIQAFEKLAAKGDTKAMIQLGIYYYEGTVIKQDTRCHAVQILAYELVNTIPLCAVQILAY